MKDMNPYQPSVESALSRADSHVMSGTYRATFAVTPEYLVEALKRHRSQRGGRRSWLAFRCFGGALFLMGVVGGIVGSNYIVAVGSLVLGSLVIFPHKLDEFLTKHNVRNSPHCNAELTVTISEDGFRVSSLLEDSLLKWAAFTKSLIFDDGALLFQGPKVVHWIPRGAMHNPNEFNALADLVRSKLPTNRAMMRSGSRDFG